MDLEKEMASLPKLDEEDPTLGITERVKEEKKAEKKKKKEEKKKKKASLESKLDHIIGDVDSLSPVNQDFDTESLLDFAKEIKKSTKKRRNALEFDADKFMNGEGKKRKEHAELVKKYHKLFSKEESLVLALLKEADADTKMIRTALSGLMGNASIRGVMGKVATDLASALISANGNRLAIIKQIAEFKKIANDYAFKEEGRKKDDTEGTLDQEVLGANALKSLFSQSTKDFNSTLRQADSVSEEEFANLERRASMANNYQQQMQEAPATEEETYSTGVIGKDGNVLEHLTPEREPVQFDSDMEAHMRELEDELREKGDELALRSEAGDNLIRNESRGVRIKIRRWLTDEGEYDWEFVAVDKEGLIVSDYEVPDKAKMKISWNDENGFAKDRLGRTYEVIDVDV